MGRTSESLQHALLRHAMQGKDNNSTETMYKKRIKIFAEWAKEKGYKKYEDITKDVVQAYERELENGPERYAPATIHTYLTPICAAAGISMREIEKPKRTAGAITRGRDGGDCKKAGRTAEIRTAGCAAACNRHQTGGAGKTRRIGSGPEGQQLVCPGAPRQRGKITAAVHPAQGRRDRSGDLRRYRTGPESLSQGGNE